MNAPVASATMNVPDAGTSIFGTIGGTEAPDSTFDALLSALAPLPDANATAAGGLPETVESAPAEPAPTQASEPTVPIYSMPWIAQLDIPNASPQSAEVVSSDKQPAETTDKDESAKPAPIHVGKGAGQAIIPRSAGTGADAETAVMPQGNQRIDGQWSQHSAAFATPNETGLQAPAETRPGQVAKIDITESGARTSSTEEGISIQEAVETATTASVERATSETTSPRLENTGPAGKPRAKEGERSKNETQITQASPEAKPYSTSDFSADRPQPSPVLNFASSRDLADAQSASPRNPDLQIDSHPQGKAAGAMAGRGEEASAPASANAPQPETRNTPVAETPKAAPENGSTASARDANAKTAHSAKSDAVAAANGPQTASAPVMLPTHAPADASMAPSLNAPITAIPDSDPPMRLTFSAPNTLDTPSFEALALKIAARSSDGGQNFSIRLDPAELGRVEVNLSVNSQGHAHAELSADKPQTLELFQKDAPALERALRDAGLNLAGGLAFSLKGDGKSSGWRDAQSGSRGRNLQIAATDAATASASMAGNAALSARAYGLPIARLDIRV